MLYILFNLVYSTDAITFIKKTLSKLDKNLRRNLLLLK